MTKHTGNSFINLFNKYDCTPTMLWGLGWGLVITDDLKSVYTLELDSLRRGYSSVNDQNKQKI